MKRVSIHQSQYIPWPPYIKKIYQSDTFVIMDSVQFQKNGVQNRNKIRNKTDEFWLTIPVTGNMEDQIRGKKLVAQNWQEKHWKSLIASYSKAPNWKYYEYDLETLYSRQQYNTLIDVNNAFLFYILDQLNIRTDVLLLSDLDVKGEKSKLVLDICRKVNAEIYVSGTGSKAYLQEDNFAKESIHIQYLISEPPIYKQFQGSYIPGLSILDMMFNMEKKEIMKYITGG